MSPDAKLTAILEKIKATALNNGGYVLVESVDDVHCRRKWMMPPTTEEWDGDLFNIPSIGYAFDRKKINNEAIMALLTGLSGERDAKMIELALMATLERSFRVRHQTAARSMLHTAGRMKAHGDPDGIFSRIVKHITNMMQLVEPTK